MPKGEPKGKGRASAGARWYGWGDLDHRFPPERSRQLRAYLRKALGAPPPDAGGAPVELGSIVPRPSRIPPAEVATLRALVPTGKVSAEAADRVLHSVGRSYVDLVSLRRGTLASVTDLVVSPGSADEVGALLAYASEHDLAVVPWGGGTSVVGGVGAEAGPHRAVVTLTLDLLARPLELDEESQLARFECGIRGPHLESYLAAKGFTLGHFPQSFERSTLGGWIAARSLGQASGRYGGLASRLRGARVMTPQGELRVGQGGEEASGPDLEGTFVGSEGTLGIFVEATVAVERVPQNTEYRGILFPDWSSGLAATRALAQARPSPAVLRLSDGQETALTLEGRPAAEGFGERLRENVGGWVLDLKGIGVGRMCLGIVGYEGSLTEVRAGAQNLARVARVHGGLDLGTSVGDRWKAERYELPYLRDDLLEDGWLVETLETGVRWKDLEGLAAGVRQALEVTAKARGFTILVGTHVSHPTASAAGLYFTLIAPQDPRDPAGQWDALKEAATVALLAHGGALSHHHGVGTLHRPWIDAYRGKLGSSTLAALKTTLDPHDTLNPGKTLPVGSPRDG